MVSGTSPSIEGRKAKGVLIGLRVVVPDPEEAAEVYLRGVFGKPFGVRKPCLQRYNDVLELSLFEALYLAEKGVIEVVDSAGRSVNPEELRKHCESRIEDFRELYSVYKDFRDRGLVVRSGLKFGSDFSIYRTAPGLEHAPYIVGVFKKGQEIDPADLVRAGRLSHSVRKKFIIAVHEGNSTRYAFIEWVKP